MHCALIGPLSMTEHPALLIESADEQWRCTCIPVASGYAALDPAPDVVVLFPSQDATLLLDALKACPPVRAPWLAACGPYGASCDLQLNSGELARLPTSIAALEHSGRLPVLCEAHLPRAIALADELLHALELRPRLGAWRFLPDMLAMTALHPALLSGLSAVLYPAIGPRFGLSAPAVERSLRIAVESAWSTSRLASLDRLFGLSIDPAKGKPTNREFLCQMSEHLYYALCRAGEGS